MLTIKKHKTQVDKDFYCKQYDDLGRFISYYYQTKLALDLNVEKFLEIGIGNKTVSSYLKNKGLSVCTCDFALDLNPDYVCDIRELPFEDKSFDCVLVYEVLEHIPFEDVESVLEKLARITRKYVIISIPYDRVYFEVIIRIPFLKKLFKKPFFDLFFHMPIFFLKHKYDGQHYWVIGRKGYSKSRIIKLFSKYFVLINQLRPPLKPYHHFFVMNIKNE